MYLPVRISNVDTRAFVDVEALVDTSRPMLVVPTQIAKYLSLPEYALIEHEDEVSVTPVPVSDDISEVIIGLGTLTALLRRVDKVTGELCHEELRI
jgi:predicted aspartyl protease